MEKKELYILSEKDIIGAFEKEGIKIDEPSYDMGCICYSVLEGEEKFEEISEKHCWVAEYVIAKNLFEGAKDGYLFCPDGDQSLPGEFNFVPIYK